MTIEISKFAYDKQAILIHNAGDSDFESDGSDFDLSDEDDEDEDGSPKKVLNSLHYLLCKQLCIDAFGLQLNYYKLAQSAQFTIIVKGKIIKYESIQHFCAVYTVQESLHEGEI